MKIKHILKLTTFFLAINLSIYFLTEINTKKKVDLVLNDNLTILETHYKVLLASQKHISSAIFETILRYTDAVKLLEDSYAKDESIQKRNREKLYEQLREQYKSNKMQGVLQMQLVFKDNISFLRVHKPSKFGDDLSDFREDIKYTNETHKPCRGFVQGKTIHGFRNIFPIFNAEKEYLGSMEISFSSEKLQWYLNNISGIHSHFLIKKELIDASMWERDDAEMNYRVSAESDEYMINFNHLHSVDNCIVKNAKKLKPVKKSIDANILKGKSFVLYVEYDGHIEVETFIPIRSLSDEVVAWIVSYRKSPNIQTALTNKSIMRVASFVISLYIFYLLYRQIRSNESIKSQHSLLKDIINGTDNIILITDLKQIKYVNNKLMNLLGIGSIEEFNATYKGHFLDLFAPMDGYLSKDLLRDGEDFFSLFKRTSQKDRAVLIVDKNFEPKAFQISLSKPKSNGDSIVTLSDITKIKEHQVKTEQKAYIDGLTNIYNRNKFDELFEQEIKSAKRYKLPLSLAVIDIDKFKAVNDTYGHLIGDEILVLLAQTLKANTRETDVVARWGGEEFVVLFRNTDLMSAKVVAENIREKIEEKKHRVAGANTASFGLTQYIEGETKESMFKRCDYALYAAKEGGRNRVEVV